MTEGPNILDDLRAAFRLLERTVVCRPHDQAAVLEAVRAAGLDGRVKVEVSDVVPPGKALVVRPLEPLELPQELPPLEPWAYRVAWSCRWCVPGYQCLLHEPPDPRKLVIITGV